MKHCRKETILHERCISMYGLYHFTAIVTEVKTIHGNGATKSEYFITEDEARGIIDQVDSIEEGFYYIEKWAHNSSESAGFSNYY